jgi:hypothetical protein
MEQLPGNMLPGNMVLSDWCRKESLRSGWVKLVPSALLRWPKHAGEPYEVGDPDHAKKKLLMWSCVTAPALSLKGCHSACW